MRKLFLTLTLAICTLLASAQFTAFTTVNKPADNEEWGMSNFTDNIGVGYYLTSKVMAGVTKNGEGFDVVGRYDFYTIAMNTQANSVYAQLQAPADSSMMDNMTLGLGYSCSLDLIHGRLRDLYIEPVYTMPLKEDAEGNREGSFKIGLLYRF
tara:strand:+ start:203 stop:661 length:459 start_codon:yes stop_codon:yes gene_type:complete